MSTCFFSVNLSIQRTCPCWPAGDNAIEIIKKVYQALLLAKKKLADVVYGSKDQWGEGKLESTLGDINEY